MTDRPLVCSCGVLLLGASYDIYNGDTGELLGIYCSAQCPDLRTGPLLRGGRRDEPATTALNGRGSLAGTIEAGPPASGGARRPRPERHKGRIRIPGKQYAPPPPFPWDAA